MARSAKDLRNIINISRLSLRDDNSDEFSSTDSLSAGELDGVDEDDFEAINSYITARPSSSMNGESSFVTFTETTRPGSNTSILDLKNQSFDQIQISKKSRPLTAPAKHGKKNKEETGTGRATVPLLADCLPRFLNKLTPIPPIATKKPGYDKQEFANSTINLTNIFHYIDGTIISSWLEQCNSTIQKISTFVNANDNFVDFAHFFLTALSHCKYCELLDLEHSIIIDHLKYVFHAGLQSKKVKLSDITSLAILVLKEYPNSLQRRKKGPKLLLDIITTFSSEKDESYRKLLKNINYSCVDKQTVQWLLAIRAFGLVSLISGILRFYENIQIKKINYGRNDICDITILSTAKRTKKWCIQSVIKNYVDVIEYLCSNQNVNLESIVDDKGRNLIYLAASESHISTLYFLAKLSPEIDVNQPSINGNTALHFIVCKGDIETAYALINIGADPNKWNSESDGATPLHTAVMSGDVAMVMLLLEHGGDATTRMGIPASTTPIALAEELGYTDIVEVLKASMQ